MREAMIILPQKTNLGKDLTIFHAKLQWDLTKAFGGCTAMPNLHGAWRRPDGTAQIEPVSAFMVAMDQSVANDERLRGIAAVYAAIADEESVYVRLADGTVHFVMAATLAQAEAMANTEVM